MGIKLNWKQDGLVDRFSSLPDCLLGQIHTFLCHILMVQQPLGIGLSCLVAFSIAKLMLVVMELSGRIEINPPSSFQLLSLKILSFFFKKYFNLATTLLGGSTVAAWSTNIFDIWKK